MNNITRFTLWGITQYDPTILDGIVLPAPLDRQLLIDEIMKRSGSLYVYQQQPVYLKKNIANWFTRNYENIKRQAEALAAEFNPIENYDRYETLVETPNIMNKTTFDSKDSSSSSGSNTINGSNTLNGSSSSENTVSAFNSSDYEPNNKTTGADSSTTTNNTSGTNTSNGTNTSEGSNTSTESGTRTHENHIHGNIGVTTASAMIREAVSLYEMDLYENLAMRFEKEFLVQVY